MCSCMYVLCMIACTPFCMYAYMHSFNNERSMRENGTAEWSLGKCLHTQSSIHMHEAAYVFYYTYTSNHVCVHFCTQTHNKCIFDFGYMHTYPADCACWRASAHHTRKLILSVPVSHKVSSSYPCMYLIR